MESTLKTSAWMELIQLIQDHKNVEQCLLWPYRVKKGMPYGLVWFCGYRWRVHRLAYRLAVGDFPAELCVLHRCDNPSCFNPLHLFLGTRRENAADRNKKGRTVGPYNPARRNGIPKPWARGERNTNAKLTGEVVRQIRTIYASGQMSQQKLAAQFGVNQTLISALIRRTIWDHIC